MGRGVTDLDEVLLFVHHLLGVAAVFQRHIRLVIARLHPTHTERQR